MSLYLWHSIWMFVNEIILHPITNVSQKKKVETLEFFDIFI